MVEMNPKWVDLYPGKQHEFGERIRVLGHARMNDGAVRLYYETIEKPATAAEAKAAVAEAAANQPAKFKTVDFGEDPKKAERGGKKEK